MIENHLLHAAAWGLLRLLPPRSAFRWTARIGRFFPEIRDEDDARAVARALDTRGTCLSRALTLASRIPDAEVVIGVDGGSLSREIAFTAHAWVELARVPLRKSDAGDREIARIRMRERK